MSGEVVTKDLGDGYYLHSYNIETYYLAESTVGNFAIPDQIAG